MDRSVTQFDAQQRVRYQRKLFKIREIFYLYVLGQLY